MSEVTEQRLEDMEALFVQTAASMTSDRRNHHAAWRVAVDAVLADRPQREVGHMSSSQFVTNWAAGNNSFADNPPNVVKTLTRPGDRLPYDAAVVIQDPQLDADAQSYEHHGHPPWCLVGHCRRSGDRRHLPARGLGAAAVGGVVGGVTGHLSKGMSRSQAKQLGDFIDPGQAGLVVVGEARSRTRSRRR